MNLSELFHQPSLGGMAIASKDGCVNTAVYVCKPHSCSRLQSQFFSGGRLALALMKTEELACQTLADQAHTLCVNRFLASVLA